MMELHYSRSLTARVHAAAVFLFRIFVSVVWAWQITVSKPSFKTYSLSITKAMTLLWMKKTGSPLHVKCLWKTFIMGAYKFIFYNIFIRRPRFKNKILSVSFLVILRSIFCSGNMCTCKSNETPTWCNTVQVLFLQSHSTCFGRKRPSSGVFKTSTATTGTCVIVVGNSSHLLIRAEGPNKEMWWLTYNDNTYQWPPY